jgi:hypothetical protein
MEFITKEEARTLAEGSADKQHEVLNELCARVYSRAVEDTIRKIPSVMSRLLVSIPAQKLLVEDFYKRNPDFIDHKDVVTKVIERIESDNPGKDYSALLVEAEQEIRKHITACSATKSLPMDKPTEVNLDGNGVL